MPTEIVEGAFDAARIQQIRTALQFTQQQFADYLGVHIRSVRNWETRRFLPNSQPILRTLAMAEQAAGLTEGDGA